MTVTFASENTQALLKHAMRLEKDGMTEAAVQICRKCLRAEAMAEDGEDMLAFLYGEGIYETVDSVKETLDALTVARCALVFYNEIRALSSASASDVTMAWAIRDEEMSEIRLVDFFSWLTRRREGIRISDKDRIAQAMYAIRAGLPLKMDDAVAIMYPVSIVRAAVAGALSVVDGMLTVSGNQ